MKLPLSTTSIAAAVLILLMASNCCNCNEVISSNSPQASDGIQRQQRQQHQQQGVTDQFVSNSNNNKSLVQKCTRQSMILARQALVNELELINNYSSIWFSDLDKDELLDEQKQSLGNIIMSGSAGQLLNGDGQPLFEVEASYFRPTGGVGGQPISVRLVRRHPDRCYLHREKAQFTYVLGLSVGPVEHYLDLVYNFPKELRLSQPINWRHAQVRLTVPKMQYEITLKQAADYKLNSPIGCPLEVADVTYLSSGSGSQMPVALLASGVANTNQTSVHLERLFNDYTRPTMSSRLRQLLKFYLNSKTLPLISA